MTTLTGWLSIINLLVLVCGAIGGVLAFRSALARAETDVQERVRAALKDENELLQSRVNRLESENKRLSKALNLLLSTLKKTFHIEIDVDEDSITVRSPNGHITRMSTDA